MREIKFRAWSPQSNKMIEVSELFIHPNITSLRGRDNDGSSLYTYTATGNEGYDSFLMQYTGLKDKNGVEIYEGDIVKMPADLWIGKESVGKAKGTFRSDVFVEYVGGSFRLNKPGDDSDNYYGVINYSINSKAAVLEVIGNIYEDPDLLETLSECCGAPISEFGFCQDCKEHA